jgi:RNA polymerase sigma-70 factor (ECF subfamily)
MSRSVSKDDIVSGSTDEALIERARRGEAQAFRSIVERYESTVAAVVHGIVGWGAEADDVGQETFVRLFRSLDRFRGDASLKTYITRIAVNLSRNALRSRKRRNARFESLDRATDTSEIAGASSDPDAFDRREVLRKAISRLDAKYRAVVVLRMLEEFSTSETADILDIPQGTVLSRLSRGLDQLRAMLEPIIEREDVK